MAFQVFISYSHRDLSRATEIKTMLEAAGASAFVAQYSMPAGTELTPAILRQIETCDLFVLLWSHHAKDSEWVPQEIGAAKAYKRPVMPVLLHGGIDVPGFLRGLKYLPLSDDPTASLQWLQQHVGEKAIEKARSEGAIWLGIVGALLWALSQKK